MTQLPNVVQSNPFEPVECSIDPTPVYQPYFREVAEPKLKSSWKPEPYAEAKQYPQQKPIG